MFFCGTEIGRALSRGHRSIAESLVFLTPSPPSKNFISDTLILAVEIPTCRFGEDTESGPHSAELGEGYVNVKQSLQLMLPSLSAAAKNFFFPVESSDRKRGSSKRLFCFVFFKESQSLQLGQVPQKEPLPGVFLSFFMFPYMQRLYVESLCKHKTALSIQEA